MNTDINNKLSELFSKDIYGEAKKEFLKSIDEGTKFVYEFIMNNIITLSSDKLKVISGQDFEKFNELIKLNKFDSLIVNKMLIDLTLVARMKCEYDIVHGIYELENGQIVKFSFNDLHDMLKENNVLLNCTKYTCIPKKANSNDKCYGLPTMEDVNEGFYYVNAYIYTYLPLLKDAIENKRKRNMPFMLERF